jgi:hypothetical protein
MISKKEIESHQRVNIETTKKEIEDEIDRVLVSSLKFPVTVDLSQFPGELWKSVAREYATRGGFTVRIDRLAATFS